MNKCNLVTDLLPLYTENLLSEDSKQFVERHLARCAECSEKLRLLKMPAAPSLQTESAPDEEREVLKKTRKKLKKHTAVVAASVCLSAIVAFCAVFFPVNGYVQKHEEERAEALRVRKALLYGSYVYSGDPQITVKPAVTAAGGKDGTQVFSFTESEETLSFPVPGEKFVPGSESHSPESARWLYAIGDVFGESKTPEIMLNVEQKSDYTATLLHYRALRGWDGDSILTKEQWQDAFWNLRQKADAGNYSELAAFCFNFPLEGITVDSFERDILLARAVRECLSYNFHLQGKAFDYFPITGAAEGFALRCTDDRNIDIFLQGRSIKMWTVDLQFYVLAEPLSPLLTDDEALTSFLEQFSLTWSAE